MLRPLNSSTLSAALQLLTAACDKSTTTEQLAQQQEVLAAALDQICSADAAVSAAAVSLLYTLATATLGRQELGKQLLVQGAARGAAAAAADGGCSSCSRLEALWASCGQAAKSSDATQVWHQAWVYLVI